MPQRNEHLIRARQTEALASSLHANLGVVVDWAITMLFYAALHYVDAYLAGKNMHPLSHEQRFYARNDHMGLTIPYEYMGIDHAYEPDFLVRLRSGVTVVLEIKGYENDQTKAKHTAANRWVEAVNNWGQLRRWAFHVCRNPQLLDKEMDYLERESVRSDRNAVALGNR